MVLYIPCFDVSLCAFSPSVLNDIYLGLGSRVDNFWERAAHSVDRLYSVLCLFVASFVCHFWF